VTACSGAEQREAYLRQTASNKSSVTSRDEAKPYSLETRRIPIVSGYITDIGTVPTKKSAPIVSRYQSIETTIIGAEASSMKYISIMPDCAVQQP
jgi:hypothetical protein